MKHDFTNTESQETAALYALGGLSQNEALAFEAHLDEGCHVCAQERKQFDDAVNALSIAATPAAPPAYVRDLLALRIDREAQETGRASVIRFPEKRALPSQKVPPSVSPFRRQMLPWAIAAALLIVSVVSLVLWRSDRNSLQAQIDRTVSESLKEQSELGARLSKESATSAELAEINSVLSAPRWRIIPLTGQEPAPDSSARIYWDIEARRWVVTADLPLAPEGKVYQLWFVTPKEKISAGLINPDSTGHGFITLDLPANLTRLAAAAITLEPEGGSQQPTMPIYVLGKA